VAPPAPLPHRAGQRLAGKIALITGAAQGLGATIAQLFAIEGASVLVTDIHADSDRRLVPASDELGGRVGYAQLDVTSEADWTRALGQCTEQLGPPSVLVLNARTWVRGTLLECEPRDWDRVMAVNLRGAMLGMRAVVPVMRELGHGSIVSIGSSMGGETAAGDGTAYQASKAGLTALTKSVAAEYGRDGIRANAIHSGPMRTETVVENGFLPVAEKLASRFPLGRIADTLEVAWAALFLASDESSYITASTIVPDGGSSSVMLQAD
jgi:NAD(P)-dependent dehydrogenase (short-subunit alcohol dehydrogenase family)